MVRLGRVARRRADAPIAFADQVLEAQRLVPAVTPIGTRSAVQQLGEGLGQAVAQGQRHDAVVVVVLGLEARRERFHAQPGGHREGTDVIHLPAARAAAVAPDAPGARGAIQSASAKFGWPGARRFCWRRL